MGRKTGGPSFESLIGEMNMGIVAKILVGIIAFEHLYILWVEMFAWTTTGKRMFKSIPEDLFEKTKGLAANQGLYNGFLAAGLIWALLIKNGVWSFNISVFFLGCVVVAGIFGGITSSKSIILKQALPAAIAIAAVILMRT